MERAGGEGRLGARRHVCVAGGAWLAASTVSGFDVLDANTGKLLNRCSTGASGRIIDIDISSDVTQAAALYVQSLADAEALCQGRRIPQTTKPASLYTSFAWKS